MEGSTAERTARSAADAAHTAGPIDAFEPAESVDAPPEPERLGPPLSFRARLTLALVAASVLPLGGFGVVVLAGNLLGGNGDPTIGRFLLFGIMVAALLGVLIAYLLAADLTAPLRAIASAVDRVSNGDLSTRIEVSGEDELTRLAESHNRLAADLERRNRELRRILDAIDAASPRDGIDWLVGRAARDATEAFGMIDAVVLLVDPRDVPVEERVPGEPRPVRSELRVGGEAIGVLLGRLPATRRWERADQDLFDLFASEIAVAVRNAQLFARVEAQNAQLLELDAAKDDFLRGVSHNLQTPLTSIRAYAQQLRDNRPDRRLTVIIEQTERLSRMVRQLLTVTRLESGALKPRADVLSLGTRARRAWEALAAEGVAFEVHDASAGWLAIGDADHVDQVLWALLDNAVKYGAGSSVTVTIRPEPAHRRLRMTVADRGPGVAPADRGRLFARFARGEAHAADEGSGLGLYVARELCRTMGGDLVLEPGQPGSGAAFTVVLPAEPGEE